jgi:hypothetical protein
MAEISLQAHEQEVERARAKLAGDLATLRDPATLSAFTADLKQEAVEAKDNLLGQAKSAAQSTANGLLEDLKAKAAANPAAALAIGAGVAWHFIRHPPVASTLIGMGIYSLWRTNTVRAGVGYQPDYLQEGKERLKEQTGAAMSKAKEMAVEAQQAVSAKAAELTDAAKDKVQQWSNDARETVDDLRSSLNPAAPPLAPELPPVGRPGMSSMRQQGQSAAQIAEDLFNEPGSRDQLLLGVASLAVAAALGIACQKRMAEDA